MSEESESTRNAKVEREAHEERQLMTVVYHALGEDLVRIRRFLEMAKAELESEEAHSARVTIIDPIELQTKAKPR
jgi:hypothetical protein